MLRLTSSRCDIYLWGRRSVLANYGVLGAFQSRKSNMGCKEYDTM